VRTRAYYQFRDILDDLFTQTQRVDHAGTIRTADAGVRVGCDVFNAANGSKRIYMAILQENRSLQFDPVKRKIKWLI